MPEPAPERITASDHARIQGERSGLELVTREYPGGPYTYAYLWWHGVRYCLGAPVLGVGWPTAMLESALRRLFADLRRRS
jgi:hypothetical protein